MLMKEWIEEYKSKTIIKVYLQPGAHKDEVCGIYGDPARLKVKIKSLPVDGRANKALINFLADVLSIKKAQISLLRGEISRNKDILVDAECRYVECFLESLFNTGQK
jgi:uncharacterized protein (TIGR00251 family)